MSRHIVIGSRAPMMDRSETDRLLGIQAVRGVAALMVVFYHATRSLSMPQYLGKIAFGNYFGFGHAGVDFFFVLSGFIITYVHYNDIGQPHRIGRYTWRRLTRIYPIYWVINLALIGRALLKSDPDGLLAPGNLTESFTLLPLGQTLLIGVAWTLEHEVVFYVLFGLAILNRTAGRVVMIAGLAAILGRQAVLADAGFGDVALSPFNLQFLMGVGVARLVATRAVPRPGLIAGLGVSLFALAGTLDVAGLIAVNQLITVLLYGAASALIIAGIAAAETAGRIRCGRAAEVFGAASYVLYLIHPLIVGWIARGLAASGLLWRIPEWAVVMIQVAAALAAAILLHRVIEQPILRAMRGLERWHGQGRAASSCSR